MLTDLRKTGNLEEYRFKINEIIKAVNNILLFVKQQEKTSEDSTKIEDKMSSSPKIESKKSSKKQ